MELKARNVNEMFSSALWAMKAADLPVEETRNGPVVAFTEPVTLTYERPQERVLFHSGRDANPIFHLLESVYLLAGRRDVAFLKQFNSQIGRYSDDGENFNAAYGYRWRAHFGQDQLYEVIQVLQKDRNTRQAVLQIWDTSDLSKKTLDKACNLCVIFDCRGGKLNMSVMNRSNDLLWGATGANAVQFSILQEFVAYAVSLPVGVYRQITNNLHLYLSIYDGQKYLDNPPSSEDYDLYSSGDVFPAPLMLNGGYKTFLRECEQFCSDPFNTEHEYRHPFFNHVAVPMAMVSRVRKLKAGDGRGWAAKIRASDWRRAVFDWIDRREAVKV